MSQDTTADEIAPLTTADVAAAVDGQLADADETRAALAIAADGLSEFAADVADEHVPQDHGTFAEPTVIHRTDDYICLYVTYGTVAELLTNTPHDISDAAAKAAGWVHNEYARRHGADADALGTMDAVVLPRTDGVETIITERA